MNEGDKRVSKKAAEAKAKAKATWTIRTPVDLRPNMTTEHDDSRQAHP